jgi:2-polyprenyl-3-methyl-5-hydroxy-6-metoxy-1,4-benzoquinol methylase
MIICPKCQHELRDENDGHTCGRCGFFAARENNVIYFHPEHCEEYDDYDREGYEKLFRAERSHFWFVTRRRIIRRLCRLFGKESGNIIEIGSGTGDIADMLLREGFDVTVSDIYRNAFDFTDRIGATKQYQFDIKEAPFVEHFDIACMFDVLEHLDDEGTAVRSIHKLLKPLGIVIITVPAMKMLWSASDERAMHKRRYDLKHLVELFNNNGFNVLKAKYFFVTLVPLLMLRALFSNIAKKGDRGLFVPNDSMVWKTMNKVMTFFMNLEIAAFICFPVFFGGSIALVGRKKSV